ncbi:hypothetical protein ACFIQG_18310 [Comamonas odontotermitis]|uniref:hypothetical protein n=1 Tax=Comamonas odontotermitis TaxID=379895 RepID=UPI00366C90E2
MTKFLNSILGWIFAALVALVFVLSWSTDHYRSKATAATKDLQNLQADVREQNHNAQKTLERLTTERDTAQAALNRHRKQQEKTDESTKLEIARLGDELKRRPVRVRVVTTTSTCGPGSGSPEGQPAATVFSGSADPAQTYGLLPPGNSERLGAVITEAETINAAYASCRSQLFNQTGTKTDIQP